MVGKRKASRGARRKAAAKPAESTLLEQVREQALDLVRAGLAPDRALLAAKVSRRTIADWRERAAAGVAQYVQFFEDVAQAEAEGEARDVITTAKAAWPERSGQFCQKCGTPVQIDLGELDGTHRTLGNAAAIALDRLGRRFPRRWSQSMRVAVEEEHEQFLLLAKGVLAEAGQPELFERLMDAYEAKYGEGDDE